MIYRAGLPGSVAILGINVTSETALQAVFYYSCIRLAYKLWSVIIVKQTVAKQGSKPVACNAISVNPARNTSKSTTAMQPAIQA